MGICLFCQESRKLTGEHVVSDWISGYVPKVWPRSTHHVEARKLTPRGEMEPIISREHLNAGDPLSKKLKIVCAECNNGWMSRIVERAKPFALPLVTGLAPVLHPVAQQRLALWMILSSMVWETAAPELAATTREDLDHIRQHETAPQGWRVWAGTSQAMLETSYSHRGLGLFRDGEALPDRCNAQITIFTVGHLAFQTARSAWFGKLNGLDYTSDAPLTRIHPLHLLKRSRRLPRIYENSMTAEMQQIITEALGDTGADTGS